MRSFLIFATFLLSSLSLSAGYKLVQPPLPNDLMQVHIFELDNGLKVYLSENHEEPKFFAEVSVRVGGANDPETNTGLAHYLEHLLFKGNTKLGTLDWEKEKVHIERITELYEKRFLETDAEKRASLFDEIVAESSKASEYAVPNELDRIVKQLGLTGMNAGTSNDYTVYYMELPSNRLEQWASLEANRFIDPVFRLFLPELEIVYEEKNRSMDNKGRIIQEEIFSLRYGDHPYGSQTVLGHVEHLKNPSIQAIHDFFNTYYVANNMALCLSGDFEIEATIELIDKHFSSWKSGEIPGFKFGNAQPITEGKTSEVFYPGEEEVYIAFSTQPLGHNDVEALKLIDMILDNANAGLINLNLNQQQKVLNAGSFPYLRKFAGTQYMYGSPKEGQILEEVEALLLDQLAIIKRGEFGDWLIPAIVADFKKSEKLGLESNQARASMMASAYNTHASWEYIVTEINRLDALSKEDVIAVANKYFNGPHVAVYRRNGEFEPPKVDKPEFEKPDMSGFASSEYGEEILKLQAKPIEPDFVTEGKDYQIVEIRDGVRLFYTRNPVNDLFSLTMSFDFGRRENEKLVAASLLLDKAGTQDLSPDALKQAWYAQGSDFSFGVDDHSSSFSISGLDENFDSTFKLMLEFIRHPVSSQEVLDTLKEIILKQRKDAKEDIQSLFLALRNYNRYGDQSPFLTRMSAEGILALKVDDLLGEVSSLAGFKHDYFYVGSLPIEQVKAKIASATDPEAKLNDALPYAVEDIREPAETEILFFDWETAQAQVRIEFADGLYSDENELGIELYNDYFGGGMSSIVFQELREARALAYSVGARYLQPSNRKNENLMLGAIGTQPDKAVEALEVFLDLFDNLPESEGRFANTLGSLQNQYRVGKLKFREIPGAVKSWELLGFESDPRPERYARLAEASFDELKTFHESSIAGRTKLISIVGPRDRLDLDSIAKLGKIREVSVEDLFLD
ncbi:MAG: insulinase family protein [Verrucomicrobia bacterium]|nr:insulinase family protein [Verrucomicrobiota bacterium]MDA1065509.1 insulinase family protein [Verrucomicrobiota bacterium]